MGILYLFPTVIFFSAKSSRLVFVISTRLLSVLLFFSWLCFSSLLNQQLLKVTFFFFFACHLQFLEGSHCQGNKVRQWLTKPKDLKRIDEKVLGLERRLKEGEQKAERDIKRWKRLGERWGQTGGTLGDLACTREEQTGTHRSGEARLIQYIPVAYTVLSPSDLCTLLAPKNRKAQQSSVTWHGDPIHLKQNQQAIIAHLQ